MASRSNVSANRPESLKSLSDDAPPFTLQVARKGPGCVAVCLTLAFVVREADPLLTLGGDSTRSCEGNRGAGALCSIAKHVS